MNIKNIKISDLLDYKIRIISVRNRRGSNKMFNGKPNCSGFNINRYIKNGMSVTQYQAMIRNNFSSSDPQYDLSKHLKHDVNKGNIELYK